MRRLSTILARTAELTRDTVPGKAGEKPFEAKPLRAGRMARAVVADGRAVHDAIEAVLAAPEESSEVARRAYKVVRDQLVAGELTRCRWTGSGSASRGGSRSPRS